MYLGTDTGWSFATGAPTGLVTYADSSKEYRRLLLIALK